MVHTKVEFGTTWYNGTGSKDKCILAAQQQQHKLLVATDVCYDHGKDTIKRFGSYKDTEEFQKATRFIEKPNFYMLIPPNAPIKLYFDIEWKKSLLHKDNDGILNWLIGLVNVELTKLGLNEVQHSHIMVEDAGLEMKGSLHVHFIDYVFENLSCWKFL